MDMLVILLIAYGIIVFISFVLVLIIMYNLYQRSEIQRREITILSQEIAFFRKNLEDLKK